MEKLIPIKRCPQCPHFFETPYPTDDSFERPSYWWCSNPDVEEEPCKSQSSEEDRLYIKHARKLSKLRLIEGYVEWHEEKSIKIPDFCTLNNA